MSKILFIVPYHFFPAKFGGALRCFHLLKELSRTNEVTLLTVQPITDFEDNYTYGFPCNGTLASITQEPEFNTIFNFLPLKIARAINSRILERNPFKKGNLYLLKTYPLLRKLLLSNKFDVVIYENLECFSA